MPSKDESCYFLLFLIRFCLRFYVFYLKVLVFAEKKQDVDAIHEYLLLKGVEAVAIHGGKGENFPLCFFDLAPTSTSICWAPIGITHIGNPSLAREDGFITAYSCKHFDGVFCSVYPRNPSYMPTSEDANCGEVTCA